MTGGCFTKVSTHAVPQGRSTVLYFLTLTQRITNWSSVPKSRCCHHYFLRVTVIRQNSTVSGWRVRVQLPPPAPDATGIAIIIHVVHGPMVFTLVVVAWATACPHYIVTHNYLVWKWSWCTFPGRSFNEIYRVWASSPCAASIHFVKDVSPGGTSFLQGLKNALNEGYLLHTCSVANPRGRESCVHPCMLCVYLIARER